MARSGGGLRTWGSLVLLGLCSWTGARAAAPNPVRNLSVVDQTNSSITLSWKVPDGPDTQHYTYWVQWPGHSGKNETRNTTMTSYTVDGLQSASSYEFSVSAEKDGILGSTETINGSTAPNHVRNPSVVGQTNSSITLSWEVPDGPNPPDYTYWVQWPEDGGKNETRNTTMTSYTVEGLKSASSYELYVWAEKNGILGSLETLKGSTAPNPVRNPNVVDQTNSSITLSWKVPDGPNPQDYTYWVQWPGDGGKNETRKTTITTYTVDGLKSASLYEFSVWAEKDGIPGSTETLKGSTAPNHVRNLNVVGQTNSSITLSWEVPDGPNSPDYTYWVQWPGDGGKNETRNTTMTSYTVEGLKSASSYELYVCAEKNGILGSLETLKGSTAPNHVRNLNVVGQTNSSITLSWEVPDGPNSPDYTYWVQWPGDGGKNETQNTTMTSYTVEGLKSASSYELYVWAEKNGILGSLETLMGSTAPNPVRNLSVEARRNNSITLQWKAPADRPADIYTYFVQWAGEGHPQTNETKDTRYMVDFLVPGTLYNFSVWANKNNVGSSTQSLYASTDPDPVTITSCISISAGYGVFLTWSCPTGGYEAFELQVGGQQISQDRSSCEAGVSVWDLQPAQSYQVTVMTIWSTMRTPSDSVTCHTESAGVIAGAIVGVLLFLILLGLLIFFLKKRYNTSQKKPAPQDLVCSSSGPILAADFADHVRKNEKDSNYGFAEEYQHLALESHSHSQRVASTPENSSKNRYKNVLPYDWSRVPLKPLSGEPGSDYINANFMPGLWSPQEFIATQGPLPQTVSDFWRLVWEQQSHTLVMLTNCVEFCQVKCEHYWPLDTQPCTYGHLQVTLVNEKVMENWTVRDLKLRHTEEQKILHVRQFHYTAWPDHGVPHSPDPLLAFREMLRQWLDQTPGKGPPIVHCSAGVGRTGTLIALDVLLRQLEYEGFVGPFSYVRKMRESRPLMVQTEAQYVFLHQCILRFLQQSSLAPDKDGAIYENLVFENDAAIQDYCGKLSFGALRSQRS